MSYGQPDGFVLLDNSGRFRPGNYWEHRGLSNRVARYYRNFRVQHNYFLSDARQCRTSKSYSLRGSTAGHFTLSWVFHSFFHGPFACGGQ